MVDESTQTLRVIKDGGLVAKSADRGITFPATISTVQRRAIRQTAGARVADGSFPIQLEMLSDDSVVRDLDGTERPLPRKGSLVGFRVHGFADAQGLVIHDSLKLDGVSESEAAVLKPVLTSMFKELYALNGLRIARGQPATLQSRTKLPVANFNLELSASTIYTLQKIVDQTAEIDVSVSMEFGMPAQAIQIRANGFGAGSMTYNIGQQRVDSYVTRSLMSFEITGPDGVLGIDASVKSTVTTRDTLSAAAPDGAWGAPQLAGEVLEEGRFRVKVVSDTPAPNTAAGRTSEVEDIVLLASGRKFEARQGLAFGYRYRLSGLPAGKALQLEARVHHPPMTGRDGSTSTLTRAPLFLRSENGVHEGLNVYLLSEPFEVLPGRWIVEILHGGRTIISREFALE